MMGPPTNEKNDGKFRRFDTIHQRDRQTDSQTDRLMDNSKDGGKDLHQQVFAVVRCMLCIASHSNKMQ